MSLLLPCPDQNPKKIHALYLVDNLSKSLILPQLAPLSVSLWDFPVWFGWLHLLVSFNMLFYPFMFYKLVDPKAGSVLG